MRRWFFRFFKILILFLFVLGAFDFLGVANRGTYVYIAAVVNLLFIAFFGYEGTWAVRRERRKFISEWEKTHASNVPSGERT
jgi:hypothetical protein